MNAQTHKSAEALERAIDASNARAFFAWQEKQGRLAGEEPKQGNVLDFAAAARRLRPGGLHPVGML